MTARNWPTSQPRSSSAGGCRPSSSQIRETASTAAIHEQHGHPQPQPGGVGAQVAEDLLGGAVPHPVDDRGGAAGLGDAAAAHQRGEARVVLGDEREIAVEHGGEPVGGRAGGRLHEAAEQLLGGAAQGRLVDLLPPAGEVAVDQWAGGARGGGDVVDRDVLRWAVAEQVQRGAEQLAPAFLDPAACGKRPDGPPASGGPSADGFTSPVPPRPGRAFPGVAGARIRGAFGSAAPWRAA